MLIAYAMRRADATSASADVEAVRHAKVAASSPVMPAFHCVKCPEYRCD